MGRGYNRRNPTNYTVDEDGIQYLIRLDLPLQTQNEISRLHESNQKDSSSSLVIKCFIKGRVLQVDIDTAEDDNLLSRVFLLSDDSAEDQIYSTIVKERNQLLVVVPKRLSLTEEMSADLKYDSATESTSDGDDGHHESKDPVLPSSGERSRSRNFLSSLFRRRKLSSEVMYYAETVVAA